MLIKSAQHSWSRETVVLENRATSEGGAVSSFTQEKNGSTLRSGTAFHNDSRVEPF